MNKCRPRDQGRQDGDQANQPHLASKFDRNTDDFWLPTCSSRPEVYKGHVPEEGRSVDFYVRLTLSLSASGCSLESNPFGVQGWHQILRLLNIELVKINSLSS